MDQQIQTQDDLVRKIGEEMKPLKHTANKKLEMLDAISEVTTLTAASDLVFKYFECLVNFLNFHTYCLPKLYLKGNNLKTITILSVSQWAGYLFMCRVKYLNNCEENQWGYYFLTMRLKCTVYIKMPNQTASLMVILSGRSLEL